MTMIGGGMLVPTPTALGDVMALLRLIADPKAASQNLDALTALGDELAAKAAELAEREKAMAVEADINATMVTAIATGREELGHARATLAQDQAAQDSAKIDLARAQADHAASVAEYIERSKSLADRAAALDAMGADLHARDAESAARSDAVKQAEADLKVKAAEWSRLAKALQG